MRNNFLWIFPVLFICPISLLNAQNNKIQALSNVDIPTSKALPAGMKLSWNDEFNGYSLDTAKWWNRYFSSLDWFQEEAYKSLKENTIPVADYAFTGRSIILRATDKLYPGAKRQISSIQTYDWSSSTNKMENTVGGFFEARIRRDASEKGDQINIAFWFDSPGPNLKYYLEKGGHIDDTDGIRPHGQLFEIDMCEYITTEIVLHGNVKPNGQFEHNIGHYIHKGDFKGKWVIHSMLWTPAGLKFYIDGEQVTEWWNPNDIKSPNHAMNMFLGAYGINDVTMEVDYVRYYQWDLENGNYLPNSGFEYSENLFPWVGTGQIDKRQAYSGKQALKLAPGEYVEQYIYLDHSREYALEFWSKGKGKLTVKTENITQVSGLTESYSESVFSSCAEYSLQKMSFQTNAEPADNKRTIKVSLRNTGNYDILVDDVKIQ